MISIVVCSQQTSEWDYHERNVKETIGCDHQYIRIDNTKGSYGICAAYNDGLSKAKMEIVVFVHEDVFFMEHNWGRVLIEKFERDCALGLVGVAGTQYLYKDSPAWLASGRPFLFGRVIHELDSQDKFYLTVFSWETNDVEVVAVDGLFFATRRSLFKNVRFDDKTFHGFHFYDLDICMQIRESYKLIVTWDILIKHLSAGSCDKSWEEAGKRFLRKYQSELPASCVDRIPDTKTKIYGVDYNLKGVVPQKTII